MARLQILELPEGASDERAPFLLVIDQVEEAVREEIARWPGDLGERFGARQVLCFAETIEIPANDTSAYTPPAEDSEQAGVTQLVYAHERTRLDLCDALLLSRTTTWRQLVDAVGEQQRTITLSRDAGPEEDGAEGARAVLHEELGKLKREVSRLSRHR
ncbi:hypothetical protein ACIRQH_35095 [Streptomyces sp. NPDC102279]|uniref:hypothetical protein n=1 Tax=Streptomyces sp. NPDC102279 TaxID=3366153 RepID=UPI0037F38D78